MNVTLEVPTYFGKGKGNFYLDQWRRLYYLVVLTYTLHLVVWY